MKGSPHKSFRVAGNVISAMPLAEDVEPVHLVTEPKSSVGYWVQRSPLEDASEGYDHKRERNELDRLSKKPELSPSQRGRAHTHLVQWTHSRNLFEDTLCDQTRSDDMVAKDVLCAEGANMLCCSR